MGISGLLVRFSVGNFRSFDDVQTFSLIAGNVRNHRARLYSARDFNLLKFAAVFGANASGKSNLIKAVQYAVFVLFGGMEHDFIESSRNGYYRLNPNNKDKNSYFEFEILIDNVLNAYGFEISVFHKKIKEEWLIRLEKTGENTQIYFRNTENGTSYFNKDYLNPEIEDRMSIYLDDYSHVTNKLFLAEVVSNKNKLYKNDNKLSVLRNVYEWIVHLDISFPNTPVSGYATLSGNDFSELLKALKSFDTGISNIISTEISKEQVFEKVDFQHQSQVNDEIEKLRKLNSGFSPKDSVVMRINLNGRFILISIEDGEPKFREVRFEHLGVSDVTFSLGEESDGTRRLLDLLSVLFARNGGVFIIDELDRSLHPQLTAHFVKTFLKMAINKNIQLLITTHESRLLNLNLLRQDEIYFIERSKEGTSNIILFDDFKERFDKKIDTAYLDGRYGAVPLFESVYPDYDSMED